MTDADVPPDGLVRTALQLLPIPDHAEHFWVQLGRAIDAESAPVTTAVAASPASAPSSATSTPAYAANRGVLPVGMRRLSNALLVAVAAGAVVVVALAGGALLRTRYGSEQVSATDPTSAAPLDTAPDDTSTDSTNPDTLSSSGQTASSTAVLTWVADVRAGRGPEAWMALGGASQAHFGSQEAFLQQLTSLASDYPAWVGGDPDQVLVTPVLTRDAETYAVVTLVGTVIVNGEQQLRSEAFPVRVVNGVAHLEPFALAGDMAVVAPQAGTTDGGRPSLAVGKEFVVVVPSDAAAPVLRVDDDPAVVCGQSEGTVLVPLDSEPGQRCSYLPVHDMTAGAHTLTMAFMGSDGSSISAQSLLFDAA